MSTWGPSKKKSAKKAPGKRSTSVNASSRSAKTTRSAGSKGSQSADPTEVMSTGGRQQTGSVRDQTPPALLPNCVALSTVVSTSSLASA